MSKNILINSSKYDSSTGCFVYRFPSPQKFFNKQVALTSISIYNQFYNCSSANNNNTITFVFNALVPVTYVFTLPDGYYSISEINYFFQQQCILNNLYCTKTNGNNVYFGQIVVNSTQYKIEIDTPILPTSANATTLGYTQAVGASWSYPASNQTCQYTLSAGMAKLLGFVAGTYPSTIQSTDKQNIGSLTPILSVVNSIVVLCNLVREAGLSYPDNVLSSVAIEKSFGSLISLNNAGGAYCDVADNYYNDITIQFVDQNCKNLTIIDQDMQLLLSIRDRP